jgi:hypothetical protein
MTSWRMSAAEVILKISNYYVSWFHLNNNKHTVEMASFAILLF